jgi:hypothetical protein
MEGFDHLLHAQGGGEVRKIAGFPNPNGVGEQ